MVAPVRPAPPAALVDALRAAHIPVESLEEACRACGEACDEDDDADLDYPKGFDMDLESTMLGELKPYGRQILVSTGKSDWIREVTDDDESIPGLVRRAYDNAVKDEAKGGKGVLGKLGNKLFGGNGGDKHEAGPPGVHPSSAAPPIDAAVSSKLYVFRPLGVRDVLIVLPRLQFRPRLFLHLLLTRGPSRVRHRAARLQGRSRNGGIASSSGRARAGVPPAGCRTRRSSRRDWLIAELVRYGRRHAVTAEC